MMIKKEIRCKIKMKKHKKKKKKIGTTLFIIPHCL